MAKVSKKLNCHICDKKFPKQSKLKKHVETVHEGIKNHQCEICVKKFGRLSDLNRHVKEVHDGVGRIRPLKRKKQLETAQKRSKNAKDSKTLKMMEKQALDVSNIAGFDHENQIIVGEEQKIKKEIKHEVKIEPVDYSGRFLAFLKSCEMRDKILDFLRDLQDLQDSKNFQFFLSKFRFSARKGH